MTLKPIIFIPGFPASELVRQTTGRAVFPPSLSDLLSSEKKKKLVALLSTDPPQPSIVAGQPIRRVLPIAKQAESLYDILRQRYGYTIDSGNNFRAIGWDWRLGVDDTAVQTAFSTALTSLTADAGRRAIVIAHSTGGLVLRKALESQPALADHIEHILAFGVPWAGNLKAFRYLTQGDAVGAFFLKLSAPQTREVMRVAQAAYDLCPPDPGKTDLTDASGRPLNLVSNGTTQIGPMVTTAWIPSGQTGMTARALAADQRLGTRGKQILLGARATPPITNVVGWGVETEVRCTLTAEGGVTFNPPVKGKPVGDEHDGDGTVALKSAAWIEGPGVRTFFLPVGAYPTAGIPNPHPRIWDSPPIEQIFAQLIRDEAAAEFVCAAADGDQSLDRQSDVTVRISAADVTGGPLPGARATFKLPGGSKTVDFGGGVRRDVVVKRTNMRPNAAPDLFRFTINVEWGTNGKRELAVVIRV